MPRAKIKHQVTQLWLGPDGSVAKRMTIGLPTDKRRAKEIHTYHVTKETRANVKFVIVEVPVAEMKKN